jgi:hypothetical protein
MHQAAAYALIRRRTGAAGVATPIGNHSFWATSITIFLKNGSTLENAAAMTNHVRPAPRSFTIASVMM